MTLAVLLSIISIIPMMGVLAELAHLLSYPIPELMEIGRQQNVPTEKLMDFYQQNKDKMPSVFSLISSPTFIIFFTLKLTLLTILIVLAYFVWPKKRKVK